MQKKVVQATYRYIYPRSIYSTCRLPKTYATSLTVYNATEIVSMVDSCLQAAHSTFILVPFVSSCKRRQGQDGTNVVA
eukprot:scaffold33386_cov60-Attheya_sp.AAC.2